MKKLLFVASVLITAWTAHAQVQVLKSEFPMYQGVATVEGKTTNEIYPKIKAWIATNFVSANDVIQLDDPDSGVLILKGSVVKTYTLYDLHTYFALTLEVKEERFRYTYSISDVTTGAGVSQMKYMKKRAFQKYKDEIGAAFERYVRDMQVGALDDGDNEDW